MSRKDKPEQNPHALLDAVSVELGVPSDYALAKALGMTPPQISKLRHHKTRVNGDTLLRMYDASGMTIEALRRHLYTRST